MDGAVLHARSTCLGWPAHTNQPSQPHQARVICPPVAPQHQQQRLQPQCITLWPQRAPISLQAWSGTTQPAPGSWRAYEDDEPEIEEEDYTWSGDADLDITEEEEDSVADAYLDLTQPSFISDTGLQAERALNQAMQAVYTGEHNRRTRGTRRTAQQGTGAAGSSVPQAPSGVLSGMQGLVGEQPAQLLPPVPPRFVGGVRVAPVPGKGWGVLATEVIEQGEALLVSEPLALIANGQLVTLPAVLAHTASTPSHHDPDPAAPQGDSDGGSGQGKGRRKRRPKVVVEPASGLAGGSGTVTGRSAARAEIARQLQTLQACLPAHHPARVALSTLWRGRTRDPSVLLVPGGDGEGDGTEGATAAAGTRQGAAGNGKVRRRKVVNAAVEEAQAAALGAYGLRQAGDMVPDLRMWRPEWERPAQQERAWGQAPLPGRLAARQLSLDDLKAVVRFNCVMEESSDPVLAAYRDEPAAEVSGLWPELALVNHSCAPSAVHVLVGGRMIVRAVHQLLPGEEVTINYLGHSTLDPLDARRQRLKRTWGFTCTCKRCRLEEKVEDVLSYTLTTATDTAVQLRRDMQDVLAAWHKDRQQQQPQPQTQPQQQQHLLQLPSSQEAADGNSLLQPITGSQAAAGYQGVGSGQWSHQHQQPGSESAALMTATGASNGQQGQLVTLPPTQEQPLQPPHLPQPLQPPGAPGFSYPQPNMRAMRGAKLNIKGMQADPLPDSPNRSSEVVGQLHQLASSALDLRNDLHSQAVELEPLRWNYDGMQQVLAAAHGLYDLIATLWHVLTPGSSRALASHDAWASAVAAVLPGHHWVTLALGTLTLQTRARYGFSDRQSILAAATCNKAHLARYGPCPMNLLQELTGMGVEMADQAAEQALSGASPSMFATTSLQGPATGGVPAWAAPAWHWEVQRKADRKADRRAAALLAKARDAAQKARKVLAVVPDTLDGVMGTLDMAVGSSAGAASAAIRAPPTGARLPLATAGAAKAAGRVGASGKLPAAAILGTPMTAQPAQGAELRVTDLPTESSAERGEEQRLTDQLLAGLLPGATSPTAPGADGDTSSPTAPGADVGISSQTAPGANGGASQAQAVGATAGQQGAGPTAAVPDPLAPTAKPKQRRRRKTAAAEPTELAASAPIPAAGDPTTQATPSQHPAHGTGNTQLVTQPTQQVPEEPAVPESQAVAAEVLAAAAPAARKRRTTKKVQQPVTPPQANQGGLASQPSQGATSTPAALKLLSLAPRGAKMTTGPVSPRAREGEAQDDDDDEDELYMAGAKGGGASNTESWMGAWK